MEQFQQFIKQFDETVGTECGFLLLIDNAKFHHKALRCMTEDWAYFTPATEEQAAIMKNEVPVKRLNAADGDGTASRAQFYRLRKETRLNADNARFVLMTPSGVDTFQPCEFLFSTMKDRLARLTDIAETTTSTIHGKRIAIERLLQSTSKHIIKGCIRASEHFRSVWIACAQSASDGLCLLSLEVVEELVRKSRAEQNAERPSTRREIGSYQGELDILQAMLNEHGGAVRVKFRVGADQPAVEVLPDQALNEGATLVIANPDGFKGTELEVQHHWLSEETAQQDPKFLWNGLTTPQTKTIQAMKEMDESIEEVSELDHRAREYCTEKNILRQVKRVQKARTTATVNDDSDAETSAEVDAVVGAHAQ